MVGLLYIYIYIYNAWPLLSKASETYTKYSEWIITAVVDTANLDSEMTRNRDVHIANPASVDEIQ